MAEAIKLNAENKTSNGKGSARAERRAGKVPGVIYGDKGTSAMVTVSLKDFLKIYNRGNIQSRLLEINLNNKNVAAITREVQVDPVKDTPIHIDFQEVKKDTLLKVMIHIKITGEEKSPGLKRGGVLNVAHRVIEFSCNPLKIPEHIVVDVSSLEIGKSIHINEINIPEGVTPIDKTNFVLASVSGRTEEKEEVAVASATTAEGATATATAATPAGGAAASTAAAPSKATPAAKS